ncbi:conserved hypothetical protein [metagenome]|uniref:AB hydrolase-1 domain-containing protein n=1 Tax=metagenome TaxID=256318 RepID=A0A2P2C149_9ZZZZ
MDESLTFAGFDSRVLERDGVELFVRVGGTGSPVVLLHGYPETHVMWHAVAGDLVRDHQVVLMDLRGYGASGAPVSDAGDLVYSKREMALDVAHVMSELGHERFAVVGHDRGARVAHRLGLDHPHRVDSLAVLDIVPTLHMFENVDREMAQSYFHWFFLTQPGGLPERLIRGDPATWLASRFAGRNAGGRQIPEEALRAYLVAFERPGVVEATCADYRAAATVDLEHDRADRGSRLQMPVLAMWGSASYVGRNFDVPLVWSRFADTVSGQAVTADHYLPEENPADTIHGLRQFWAGLR